MVITRLDNDKVKYYIKLKDRKYRKKEKKFIVEGMHLVLEAYKNNIVKELILEENVSLPLSLPAVYVTKEVMNKLSEMESPSDVMALCRIEEKEITGNKFIMLDDIQDPGNLGTIIRSAAAFNIDTVILSPNTVDLYNPKVIRGTQGMIFNVNIVTRDLISVIDELKQREIPIYGTRVNYGDDVRALKNKDKSSYCLIVGNEGQGIKDEILDKCDLFLHIDMNDKVESLNVGVAASIILYELDRGD